MTFTHFLRYIVSFSYSGNLIYLRKICNEQNSLIIISFAQGICVVKWMHVLIVKLTTPTQMKLSLDRV